MRVFTVHQPFGDYAKGDMIKDPEVQAALVESGQAAHCTPTDVDESFFAEDPSAAADEPAPAPKGAKAKT